MRWIILVLMLAGTALGQATQPTASVAGLQKEISRLRAENATLKTRLAELQERVATLEAELEHAGLPTTQPAAEAADATDAAPEAADDDEIQKAIKARELVVGMTLDQANKAMRREGKFKQELQGGMKVYEWTQRPAHLGIFMDGKLVHWEKEPTP